jgi:hypothetical protein
LQYEVYFRVIAARLDRKFCRFEKERGVLGGCIVKIHSLLENGVMKSVSMLVKGFFEPFQHTLIFRIIVHKFLAIRNIMKNRYILNVRMALSPGCLLAIPSVVVVRRRISESVHRGIPARQEVIGAFTIKRLIDRTSLLNDPHPKWQLFHSRGLFDRFCRE